MALGNMKKVRASRALKAGSDSMLTPRQKAMQAGRKKRKMYMKGKKK